MIDEVSSRLAEATSRHRLPSPEVRRMLRLGVGLSQEAVAEILGVTRVAVTRYESGQRLPGAGVAGRYQELLNRFKEEIRA